MREVFIPSIKDYAKRINVDFILMNNNNSKYYNTWNQLQFMDYLDYYDRVMYIDGDCYVPKLFRSNFFNKIDKCKIGLYKTPLIRVPQCIYTFTMMIINNKNRQYFPKPSLYEQKYKWERKTSNYICLLNRPISISCYEREECYINECINRYKITNKIAVLTNLETKPNAYFLTNIHTNTESNIIHIILNTNMDKLLNNIDIARYLLKKHDI